MNKIEELSWKVRELHTQINEELAYAKATDRPLMSSPEDAAEVFRPFFSWQDHEELWVANLDTRNRLIKLTQLYVGTVDSSNVRVAEVFREAIILNAPNIIVAHNHPAGSMSPSVEDINMTRSLVAAGKILDISLLDHIIISRDPGYMSFRERGVIA